MTTTDEPTTMRLTDQAKALADAQPVIDIHEAPPDDGPGVEIERAAPAAPSATVPEMVGPSLIPGADELTVLAQLAVTFAQAGLVPRALQGKPADVLLVLMTGRGLGIDPLVALRECHPIDGKVTVSPKLKLAIVRQRGLGEVWPDPANDGDQATWHAVRVDDTRGTVYSASYSMADAQTAGLAGKDNWTKYPRQMLQWRALGYLLDVAFGEVGTGLYSADELGAVTDDEGHAVIDVTEVAPLAGMEPALTPAEKARIRADEKAAAAAEPAPEIDVMAIKAKIATLPPPARDALAALWSEPTGQINADGVPIPRLWPVRSLPTGQVKTAYALVDSVVKRAEKGEWGVWVGHGADIPGEAPTGAQDAPETDPAADAPDTPPDDVAGDEDETCGANDGLCDELAVVLDDDSNPYCASHAPEGLIP